MKSLSFGPPSSRLFPRKKSPSQTLVSDYHINIFYSEEDGGYIGDIPDLEACSAFGATPDEALAEVEKAKAAWLAAARDAASPPLPPHYRPAIYQTGR